MSENTEKSTTRDASLTAFRRSLPISDLKIPMPETKPPKNTSVEQVGVAQQNQGGQQAGTIPQDQVDD